MSKGRENLMQPSGLNLRNSEMGRLIHSKDWSATALGSEDHWPQSLKTTLSVVLNSKFPMFLFWGESLICFYNDAFRPSLGSDGKHPKALGSEGAEVWAEIWPTIKPWIDQVLMGGEAIMKEDQLVGFYRNGQMEDIYWTFNYSAVYEESGKIGGVLVICQETTDSVLALQREKEKKQEYENLFMQAPTAIAIVNAHDQQYSLANPLYEQLFAGADQEVLGKSTPSIGGQSIAELFRQVSETGEPFIAHEFPIPFRENGPGYLNLVAQPIKNAQNAVSEILIHAFDVTEQIHARKKIEESDAQLRSLLQQAPVAMTLLKGPDRVIEVANEKALELWGRSSEEVVGRSAFEAMPELIDQGFQEILEKVYSGERFIANEFPLTLTRHGKPELLHITFIYEPIKDENGCIESALGIGIDVSEQVNARMQIEKSEQQLKRFKHMADHATEPFILMREDGTFAYLNDLALQRWGYTADEIESIRVPDVDPIYQDEQFNKAFAAAQKGPIPQFETLHKRKDGTIYPVEINMGGLTLEGKPHMFAVARDITDRKRMESILNGHKQALEQSVNGEPLSVVLGTIAKATEEQSSNQLFASILLSDSKANRLLHGAAPSLPDSYNLSINGVSMGPGVGSCGTAAYAKEEVVVRDIASDPLWEGYKDLALSHGLRACWSSPILSSTGDLLGTFALYYPQVQDPTPTDREAVELLSRTAGIVIEWYQDIQLKNETERNLKESDRRFRALVNATSDVVYRMSPDWSEMRELEGRGLLSDTGNVIKDWLKKYIYAEDREKVVAAFTKAVHEKGVLEAEYRVLQDDGTLGWTFSRAIPILDEDGEILEWFGTASDITDRKRTEEALRIARDESERMKRLYEAVTASTPDLIYVFDLDYRFTYANEALLAMLGRTWEETVGRSFNELGYVPWVAEMHEREIGEIVATRRSIRGDVSFQHAKLGERIYDYIFVPVVNAEGEVEAVAGTSRDITEIKTFEESLKDREQRFRNLAEAMPQLVWTTEADGYADYFNNNWYEYTGGTPASNLGKDWTRYLHPEEREAIWTAWTEKVMSGKPVSLEYRLRGKDGSYRWFLARGLPQYDQYGNIVMWFGTSTDIEDQKRALQQKDEFMSIASHELKTPITSVKASLQITNRLFKQKQFDVDIIANFLTKAEVQVDKLTSLINDLLDISRIKAGKLIFNFAKFDLGEIINDCVAQENEQAKHHQVIAEVQGDMRITGDKIRLEQVITNLLSNAVKYSPNADKVVIRAISKEKQVEVSVTDFGIGIPKEKQNLIFDRFYRAEEALHQFQGLGLGLFISHEIVLRHEGKMWVESKEGEGSTFYFVIPQD